LIVGREGVHPVEKGGEGKFVEEEEEE